MNIGIVTTWFERGAAYVSRQFKDILEKENNVFIFARAGEKYAKGDPNWDGPNVFWSSRGVSRFNPGYMLKSEFTEWIKKNNIEVVIFNEQQNFTPIIWCNELGVKTLAYIDYYTEETVPLFKVYDALICNTKRHYSAFKDLGNSVYVPWGTNTELYKPNGTGLVNKDKVTFFNSAGMAPIRKGTGTFIKAIAKCKDLDFKAIIQAQVKLDSIYPDLKDDIQSLINNGKLEVIEKTVPAPGLYTSADVYVYPSILDGIGLTICEAISSGLACITSDNPPMNEFIQPQYGSLIEIDRLWARKDAYYWPQCRCNADSLVEIMQYYIANPEEVIKKKIAAREWAIANFSFEKNAACLNEVVKKIRLTEISESLKKDISKYENKHMNSFMHPLWIATHLYTLYDWYKSKQLKNIR